MKPDDRGYWLVSSSNPPTLKTAVEAALNSGELVVSYEDRIVGLNVKELLKDAYQIQREQVFTAQVLEERLRTSVVPLPTLPPLAQERLPICAACSFGRRGVQITVCAKQFPQCDCSCVSKINQAAAGMVLWASEPSSKCPHPDSSKWPDLGHDLPPQ